jgi:predicted RNase H-like HicB family nuclease
LADTCPEVPEANGQGKMREECLESLAAAIELVLDYRREQSASYSVLLRK